MSLRDWLTKISLGDGWGVCRMAYNPELVKEILKADKDKPEFEAKNIKQLLKYLNSDKN